MENPAANQLPEADSLPDGFVESTAEPLAPSTPTPEQEKLVTDYKEEKLLEPDLGPKFVVNDFQSSECDTVPIQKLRTFPVALSENDTFDALQESVDVINEDHIEKNEDILVVGAEASSGSGDAVKETGERLGGSVLVEEQVKRKCQSSEIAIEGGLDPQPTHAKVISSVESVESNKKTEASEVKRKNAKRTFKSEKEFLEFTLKYQQVLAERDGAIAVRDKLESLCRELQRQNKMLMDECKRVSTEGQNLRLDLSTKFQDAIKEVSNKLEEQKDESLSQLKENEIQKMANLAGKVEAEVEIKCDADEFFHSWGGKAHHLPNLCSENLHNVEVHEGDWKTEGSVKLWTFVHGADGGFEGVKRNSHAIFLLILNCLRLQAFVIKMLLLQDRCEFPAFRKSIALLMNP